MTKLSIEIPFSGFYESQHNASFDNYIERESEYLQEECGASEEQIATLNELFYTGINWKAARVAYSEKYVEALQDFMEHEGGKLIALKFEELSSPKYYNYTTDRIFCNVLLIDVVYMAAQVGREALAARVLERFSHRDGFVSSYDNDLNNWPLSYQEWDYNQLSVIIECYIEHITLKEIDEIINSWDIMENFNCNGGIDEIIHGNANKEFTAYYNALLNKGE